ncbi:MAG TPA: hypothetical protein VIR38_00645 [Thalassobaculum sp.]
MFQVAVWDDCDPHAGTRTLIALADDAADLCNLQVFDDTEIVTVVTLPGLVATNGPSRVIGATRNVWSAPRSR